MAIYPSIVMPTHYTGEPNHVSDTEQTTLIDLSQFELKIVDHESNQPDEIKEKKSSAINDNVLKHHIELWAYLI